jgi:hypothetical protein
MALSLDSIYQPLNEFFLKKFGAGEEAPAIFRFSKIPTSFSDSDFLVPDHPDWGPYEPLARELMSWRVDGLPMLDGDGRCVSMGPRLISELYRDEILAPALPQAFAAGDVGEQEIVDSFNKLKADALVPFAPGGSGESASVLSGLKTQSSPSIAAPKMWWNKNDPGAWTHQTFQIEGAAPGPQSTVVSQGESVLRGTWLFSFDSGAETNGAGADIWWEQQTQVQRALVPRGAAAIVNLGLRNFDSMAFDELQSKSYGSAPIPGNADASNQLVAGDVFAVRTQGGNFAKVQVLEYGYNLRLRWVTYGPATPGIRLGTSDRILRMKIDDARMRKLIEPHVEAAPAPSPSHSAIYLSQPATTMARPMFAAALSAGGKPLQAAALAAAPAPNVRIHSYIATQMAALPVRQRTEMQYAILQYAPTQTIGTTNITIDFDYCVVDVARPWLHNAFLDCNSWYIPGQPKGKLSANDGHGMPAIPVGFVAIKNLQIRAPWTPEDISNLGQSVQFGPFGINSKVVDGAIGHEGIQIVGWLLQELSNLPPCDAP